MHDLLRRQQVAELHAFGERILDLVARRRHFLLAAPVNNSNRRAVATRAPRRIDRRVAATENHHALAPQGRRRFAAPLQVLDPGNHARTVLAGDPEMPRSLRPDADEKQVMPGT